jgi:8-oxo-dGTP pyrophosphatase MutT (NUDIX family)
MEDNPLHWICERSEEGPDLKIFKVRFDLMRNPRNGKSEKMTILESEDAVNVVALTSSGDMLLVRQYRFGTGQVTLELPGGFVEPGELQEHGARRELLEETGYAGAHWEYLGSVGNNPVFMDGYIHHWLVTNVEPVSSQSLDDGEEVYIELIPVDEVERRLWDGDFAHPHTISGLLRFFAKRNYQLP